MFTLKKTITFIVVACTIHVGYITAQTVKSDTSSIEKLQKIWESPDGLDIPESAYYNHDDKTIYVSNIVGNPDEKDGKGFISKISKDGKTIEAQWVIGLNAPKGMGVLKGKLYVTDIDEVLEISLETGQILKRYNNSLMCKKLNDITIDHKGRIYVTELDKHLILMLGKDSLEIFAESDQISGDNGICDFGKEVILASNNNLIAINKKTKAIRIIAKNTGYMDGIIVVGKNKIITSDWAGKIQLIEPGKPIVELLNTTAQKLNATDLGWIPDEQILLVPTFFNNKIIAYKLHL